MKVVRQVCSYLNFNVSKSVKWSNFLCFIEAGLTEIDVVIYFILSHHPCSATNGIAGV
jgi:hypothetical protein